MKLFKKIDRMIERFCTRDTSPNGMRFFRTAVYAWVLLSTLTLLPAHDQFWSAKAFIDHQHPAPFSWFYLCTNLLALKSVAPYYGWFVFAQITLLALAISGVSGKLLGRLIGLGILFTTLNLDNQAWITMDGGNNLMHILLVYLVFLNPLETNARSSIHHLANNFSYLASRLQVVIVYLGAGLSKLSGPLWQKGVALYYVMNTDEYSHPAIKTLAASIPSLIVLGTYFTLAFQISFPWLVWNRKTRPWVILTGTFMHLQIAFGMGLYLFGLAMCTAYTSFADEKRARKILAWFGLTDEKVWIAFDENCSVCMKVARITEALDWKRRIIIDSAQTPKSSALSQIPKATRLFSIHSVMTDGGSESSMKVLNGFSAMSEGWVRLPILLPFVPFIRFLQLTGIGDTFYRRYVISSNWRKQCAGGFCIRKPEGPEPSLGG